MESEGYYFERPLRVQSQGRLSEVKCGTESRKSRYTCGSRCEIVSAVDDGRLTSFFLKSVIRPSVMYYRL